MSAPIIRPVCQVEGGPTTGYMFFCPGCEEYHRVSIEPGRWTFDGNMERPTFSPSVLVRARTWDPPVTPENMDEYHRNPWPQTEVHHVCHSFVRDGQIQFLGDCTHKLAGQTVPLPPDPWEEVEATP